MKNTIVCASDVGKIPPESFYAPITYSSVDGYHVFTSERIQGLFIASKDPQKALRQLVPTIEALLAHNLKNGTWKATILHDLKEIEFLHKSTKPELKSTIVALSPYIKQAA